MYGGETGLDVWRDVSIAGRLVGWHDAVCISNSPLILRLLVLMSVFMVGVGLMASFIVDTRQAGWHPVLQCGGMFGCSLVLVCLRFEFECMGREQHQG